MFKTKYENVSMTIENNSFLFILNILIIFLYIMFFFCIIGNFFIGFILVKPLQFLIIPIIIGIEQVITVQTCAKAIQPLSSVLIEYSFPAVIFINASIGICINVKTRT